MSKSNPSKNALTHGFYATDVVLPWENQQEFDDLLRRYMNEYPSDGVSEEAAVFELASLHWKKRRLEDGLMQAIQKQRDFDAKMDDWDVGAAAKSQSKAVQAGCALVLKHLEQLYQSNKVKANSQANGQVNSQANNQAVDFDKLNMLMKELNLAGTGFVVPMLQAVEQLQLNQIERAFQPHILEKELKIQAEFDRRIDKVMRRLALIKLYKEQYCAKSINAKQIEATKLPPNSSTNPVGPETNGPDVVSPSVDPGVGKDTKH